MVLMMPMQCGVMWHSVAQCSVLWCSVVWCTVVQCSMAQCRVVWCSVVWVGLTLAVESRTKLVTTTSSTEQVRKPWNQYSMLSQGARDGAGSRTGVRQGALM